VSICSPNYSPPSPASALLGAPAAQSSPPGLGCRRVSDDGRGGSRRCSVAEDGAGTRARFAAVRLCVSCGVLGVGRVVMRFGHRRRRVVAVGIRGVGRVLLRVGPRRRGVGPVGIRAGRRVAAVGIPGVRASSLVLDGTGPCPMFEGPQVVLACNQSNQKPHHINASAPPSAFPPGGTLRRTLKLSLPHAPAPGSRLLSSCPTGVGRLALLLVA